MAGMAMAAPVFLRPVHVPHAYIYQTNSAIKLTSVGLVHAWLAAVSPSGLLWTRYIDLAARVGQLEKQGTGNGNGNGNLHKTERRDDRQDLFAHQQLQG